MFLSNETVKQLYRMMMGSVTDLGIRIPNVIHVTEDLRYMYLFHTSNVDLRTTGVYPGLYCMCSVTGAVQQWNSRVARKICNYVNIIKVPIDKDVRFFNGDRWERYHGGRCFLSNFDGCTVVDCVLKSCLRDRMCELQSLTTSTYLPYNDVLSLFETGKFYFSERVNYGIPIYVYLYCFVNNCDVLSIVAERFYDTHKVYKIDEPCIQGSNNN